MIILSSRFSRSLLGALALYVALCVWTVRDVGIVGEVAIGWALPSPPDVLVALDPPVHATSDAGLFRSARSRPMERLVVGNIEVPLAVNTYTGGMADWPARVTRAATGSIAVGTWTHVALGALLIALAHRFLVFHGTRIAAGAAAWVLATDWSFVFYRKVLGGTEILLQAAALLVLWALWSRRWKGGVHGTVALAVGVGLGLAAKVTFVATLAAFALTVLATRWDHPALKPPRRVHPGVLLGIPLLAITPLLVANVHQHGLAIPEIPSHDTLGLQLARLTRGWTGHAPAREGYTNLVAFFGDPLSFFASAYGARPTPPLSFLRLVGYAVTLLGVGIAWRDRAQSPAGGLLRFLSLFVPFQLAFLLLANRDLHHLAQASLPLALLVGLAADRVAGTTAPPRSFVRTVAAAILVSPLVLGGALQLARTDAVVDSVTSPSFTEQGQAALVEMLRAHGVERVVASDYELYGMLEARAPEIAVAHTWGAVARGAKGRDVLRYAAGGWFLAVRASAPMIYNWSPDARKVEVSAREAGVSVTEVDSLSHDGAVWATLWQVEPAL